jgi:hypothetical protein
VSLNSRLESNKEEEDALGVEHDSNAALVQNSDTRFQEHLLRRVRVHFAPRRDCRRLFTPQRNSLEWLASP